jgi:hypothetical protein
MPPIEEEYSVSGAILTVSPVTIAEFDAFLDAQQDDSL